MKRLITRLLVLETYSISIFSLQNSNEMHFSDILIITIKLHLLWVIVLTDFTIKNEGHLVFETMT